MADVATVPKRAIAPRLANGPKTPHVGPDLAAYHHHHQQTVGDGSDEWWAKVARETLHWDRPFQTVRAGGFETGDIVWFPEGGLNASYNCVDRWAFKHPNKTAIIWEADEPGKGCSVTYAELLREVCALANVLKSFGVKKGDTVSLYLPMTWQAVAAFLACARIGAVHAVVFAGFSAESLRDRVVDCRSRVIITSDEGRRGGKSIATKTIVDKAVLECPEVEHVLVLKRTGNPVPFVPGRDKWWHEETAKVPAYCPPEVMAAEDPLFILYTSGSTGTPKGVVHTTGGYLLGAALTVKYIFDVHPESEDVFACVADIGWITGHTYVVYGPLLNGVTTLVFEPTPTYPTPARYWQAVDTHKVTQFYTAPTAIRLLRRLGAEHVTDFDLSSLRVLGSVGEPINPEAWGWYDEHVGRGQCAIVDTFWQTETGSIVIAPFPGAVETKPGAATVPFFGIQPALVDPVSGEELKGNSVEGVLVLKNSWPSIARTVYRDHKRYIETYMKPYPGYFYTGDGAARDEDGYIWIKGRVDDVINVSGHRLSTAEIESALIQHKGVAETAVIGAADELTGQAVYAFVTLKPEFKLDSATGAVGSGADSGYSSGSQSPGADGRKISGAGESVSPSSSSSSSTAVSPVAGVGHGQSIGVVGEGERLLIKELALHIRKVIGPFATPKRIVLVGDLPKTRSGKIMRRVLRKIVAGEADQLGDLSTLADPAVVVQIVAKVGLATAGVAK